MKTTWTFQPFASNFRPACWQWLVGSLEPAWRKPVTIYRMQNLVIPYVSFVSAS
ncbi:hypothetical protein Psta_3560 [Pirellula staleyi DSM 6068]|uniref:Uncharacterized protein n=1 Tax=Pirellula staleyi (strain ATCC 27377 / DSM 6068 / ICPB 4128) TaxID=530564 RepID=D2QZ29_PIRSD|nr:hypothetical protein Psta_3560 [Pirellula staleyi DSM 6068]